MTMMIMVTMATAIPAITTEPEAPFLGGPDHAVWAATPVVSPGHSRVEARRALLLASPGLGLPPTRPRRLRPALGELHHIWQTFQV